MNRLLPKSLRKYVLVLSAVSLLGGVLIGCSSKPVEKSPEEIEKNRIEHSKRAQRELQDG